MLCLLFFFLAPHAFQYLMLPLQHSLPKQSTLIATQLTSALFVPIKLAADMALLGTAPFALLQTWYYVSPALYQRERHHLYWTIIASLSLFCLGVLFCFFIVLPFMLQFFAAAVPTGVRLLPDITYALDFMTRMLLLFGLSFQLPLICLVAVYFHWLEYQTLTKARPYAIVAAFTLGMLLTPPDVFSQVILAIPLCLLYELGLQLAKYLSDEKRERVNAE